MRLLSIGTVAPFSLAALMSFAACGDNGGNGGDADARPNVTADAGVDNPDAMVTPEITVSAATVSVTEGGAATSFDVSLSSVPSAAVTVSVASSDDAAATGTPTTLTFTTANFDTAQTVTVAAIDDDDAADETVTFTLAATGLTDVTVTATVTDDDSQGLALSTNAVAVVEEATGSVVTVALTAQPAADVTVTVTSDDPAAATALPGTLTFTSANWATAQDVTVTGIGDADTANETVTVTVASTGLTDGVVDVTVTDDDVLNISATAGPIALSEGGATGSISVVLTQQPPGSVTVNVASDDDNAVGVSTATLAFDNTDWNVAKTVTLTPQDDDDAQDESVTVTFSATALTSQPVTVTVADDETQAIVLSASTLTVAEGAAGVINVTLAANPLASVSVTVASADGGAASTGDTTLSFDENNWNTAHPVNISGVQDDDLDSEVVLMSMTSAGLGAQTVTVTVTDDDSQSLVVSANSLPVTEGSSSSFGVHLAFDPRGTVTVNLDSGNTGIATVTPASFTFDSSDWSVDKSVMVAGVDDADLIDESTSIAVSSSGLTPVSVSVNVQDDDAQGIIVTPALATISEGGVSQTLNVRLAFDPGGTVTVAIESSDTGAATVNTASMTFDSTDFSVTKPVTVSPVDDPNTADESVDVDFTASGISATTVPVTVNDDDVQALILSTNSLTVNEQGATAAFTVRLAFDPVDPITVTINSSDTGAASVSTNSITFNTGDYTTPKSIDVAGISDPDLVDESPTITVATASAADATVDVIVTEDDLQSLVVTHAASFEVTEDIAPLAYTVELAFQPPTTVGVTNVSAAPAAATVSKANLLFTTTNYDDPQSVTVNGTTDMDLHDTSSSISVQSPGLTGTTFGVTVFDDDSQDIVVASTVTVNEGGTFDVSLALAFEPYCEQASPGCSEVITISSPDVDAATASLASVSFTAANYTVAVPMTISGIDDADTANEDVLIGLDSAEVTTTDETIDVDVLDDDTQNFDFAKSTTDMIEGDEPGTIGVRLTQDPVTAQTVSATSADSTTVTVSGSPLTFDSGNYTVYQYVTVTAVEDIDLLDEDIAITFSSSVVTDDVDRVLAITDNDEQAILLHAALTGGSPIGALDVLEEGTSTVYVSLAFQPSADLAVHVGLALGEDKLSLGTTDMTFTGLNFQTRIPVVISGLDDAPEDLDDHLDRTVTVTTSPEVAPGVREGATVDLSVDVLDTDAQEILVTLEPDSFPISIQEGGPTDNFFVALAYPPRNDVSDVVQVDSPNAAELEVNGTNSVNLTFTAGTGPGSWSVPQEVVVTALDDFDDVDQPGLEADDDFNVGLDIPTESSPPEGPGFSATSVAVHVVDDERLMIQNVTISAMDGATRHTRRQNVNWFETLVGITAFDASSPGDVVLATAARDNLASLAPTVVIANSTGVSAPVQSIEFDGTHLGVFASDATDGIVYGRYSVDLASEIVAPTSVAGTTAIDFWPSWNGDEYGLVYRDANDNNLLFRTVQDDGTASSASIVTVATASAHQHPNLHPRSGGGWVVFYTTSTAVRCVRLDSAGDPVGGSDVALAGLPAGAFVSSVANPDQGTLMLAYNHPTNGLSAAEVNPELCEVLVTRGTNFGGGQILNTPFIAFNGLEYKVAYDLTDGSMGVTTLDDRGRLLDDTNAGTGSRPSIAWAGDRWVLRAQGSVVMQSGSYQTHCSDGVENLDESGPDCGGSDCVPCVFEFSFTSTNGDDLPTDALYEFFSSIQGLVGSTDSIQFAISGDPGSRDQDGWCADGNADWYVDNYIRAFETGSNFCGNAPTTDMYNMCPGETEWAPDGSRSAQSCYNNSWSNGLGTWVSADSGLTVGPSRTDSCELQDQWNGCSDGSWTFTLRLGAGGDSSIAEVCNAGVGFAGNGTCGGGGP